MRAVYHLTQLIISASQAAGMTKEQLKELETTLQQKRRDITSKMSGMDTNPEYGRDEGDRANASQDKEMTWRLNSQERGLLELIDSGLSRIRDGTFGECEHCGHEIGCKRLAAIPWTRYCITCQELLEEYGSERSRTRIQ
jgi:DnaK suppressor protein